MNPTSERQHWYALQLRTRFEKVVDLHLQGKGYETYLPLFRSRRQWTDRVKELDLPLFPGYIFCKFDVRDRLPLLTIPGVMSVVSFGGMAYSVPEHEIAGIQNVVNSGLPYGPWPFMSGGQRVYIRYGPLRGLEGVVLEAKQDYRLIVSVTMLQRSVSVCIERDCVMPILEAVAKAS